MANDDGTATTTPKKDDMPDTSSKDRAAGENLKEYAERQAENTRIRSLPGS